MASIAETEASKSASAVTSSSGGDVSCKSKRKVDPHWHWEELDLLKFARETFAVTYSKPKFRQLVESDACKVAVRSVRVDGEATLNKRKGKYFLVYDLELTVKWVGTVWVGQSIVGNADGRFKM